MQISRRFDLTAEQLAAAAALAGVTLPVATAHPLPPGVDPISILVPIGAVADGQLSPELDHALRLVAMPARTCTLTLAGLQGRPTGRFTLVANDALGPYCIRTKLGEHYRIALLPSLAEASLTVRDVLCFDVLPTDATGDAVELSVTALAALAARTDALRAQRLRAELAHRPHVDGPVDAPELETQLALGLDPIDTRWAVGLLQLISPLGLEAARGSLAAGLSELHAAGLVATDGAASTMAARLATTVSEPISAGLLTTLVHGPTGSIPVAAATIVRSLSSIVVGIWIDGATRVRFLDGDDLAALRLVRDVLGCTLPDDTVHPAPHASTLPPPPNTPAITTRLPPPPPPPPSRSSDR